MQIYRTKESDLEDLLKLWNNPEVMRYVGFPDGLKMTYPAIKDWYSRLSENKTAKHYIMRDYSDNFVGELFYASKGIDQPAIIDVKIEPKFWDKHLGRKGLSFCLDQLFRDTEASRVMVDPNAENLRAIKLYENLGFRKTKTVNYAGNTHLEMELEGKNWKTKRLTDIALKEVTSSNFREVCFLSVRDDQKGFIATNSYSLAQAAYEKECKPLAVYCGDNVVGFVMYAFDTDEATYWIYRLMIGKDYQGLGYGKKAMELALEILMPLADNRLIRISFEPQNSVAQKLYESLGFVTTGRIEGGEVIYEKRW
ncbi:MAG: N-acetyltransferase [Bacilli bacterium]|nr:N-acetyltransferase [Bacilli bacterium]